MRAIHVRTFSASSLATEALQLDEKHDWTLHFVQLIGRQYLRSSYPETKATSTTSSGRPNAFGCYRVLRFAFAQTSSGAMLLYGNYWIRHSYL